MTQKFKNSKTDILEQFFRVRYAVSMNFIDVLKKEYMLQAKNAIPQYANEIKVQIFKISKKSNKHSKNDQNTSISVKIDKKMLKN